MTDQRQALGKKGELLAVNHLRKLGYGILERNFRVRSGEIDIIARDGETLVFVEVKARSGEKFGSPGEAVNRNKQRKLSMVALEYLAGHGLNDCDARFDVVGVLFAENGTSVSSLPRIEVFKNAFELCYGN